MPRETLEPLRAQLPQTQAVPDVRADRSISLDLPAAGGGRPPPRLDRQGDPERRDPRAARGRHALRAGRARRARASRRAGRAWATGTIAEKTAERFKPLPGPRAGPACCRRSPCSPATPCARDEEGFLYFIGRRDEMIKTSGYRVSPTEVEEVLYAHAAGRRMRGLRRAASGARARRSSSSRRRPPARRVDDRRAARRTAASGCRPTWCRRRSTCATARCRATRTARSTARRSPREFAGAAAEGSRR